MSLEDAPFSKSRRRFGFYHFSSGAKKKLFNYGTKNVNSFYKQVAFFSEGNGVFSWQITLGVVGLKKHVSALFSLAERFCWDKSV